MATKARVEQPGRPGRKPSLNAEHTAVLRAITREQPRSSLDEVTRELFRRAGVKVSTVTVRKVLREAGIERPKTFPPWQATYKAFRRWAAAGVFEAMHDRLRQQWRDRMGRAPDPTAAIIDAQSTRSTAQGGNTGFDAGKKVKGRKRHLVVDTLGLLLAVTVTAASVQDRDAAAPVVAQVCAKVPGLKKLYADGAYGGKCATAIEQTHGIAV